MKSFRVFLHGNNLIAILAWFVWQGFARGESLNHSTKCTGNRSEYRRRNTVDLFPGIVTVAYFQVCEVFVKMSSPIHLK